MPLVRFTCPRCKAMLKFNHPSPQGKRVRCAKCRTISSVRLAQPRPVGMRPTTKLITLPALNLDDPPSEPEITPPPARAVARAAAATRPAAAPAKPVVYEPDEAPDDFDEEAAPPKKKGLDATPLLVGLVICAYLGAVAAAYFGAFDGDAFTGGLSAGPGQRVAPKDAPSPRDDTTRESPP